MFSVRIVTTDHYMSAPLRGLDVQYADQRGSEVKKVPVVRIFGATPAGKTLLFHINTFDRRYCDFVLLHAVFFSISSCL